MRVRAMILGAFLALAAAIALWPTRDPRPAMSAPPAAFPLASQAVPVRPGQAAGHPRAEEPGRIELFAEEPEDVEVPFIIRGRCVDEEGRPLPGVAIRLDGSFDDEDGDDDPADQMMLHAQNGPDGAFVFRFLPGRYTEFSLLFTKEGFIWYGRSVDPVAAPDLGDVVLRRGTRIRGRVLGTAGVPVRRAKIRWMS